MKNIKNIHRKVGLRSYFFCIIFIAICSFYSCTKRDDFLNAVPTSSIVAPKTLNDFQGLMDNGGSNVQGDINISPALGEDSDDDYYMNNGFYNSLYLPQDGAVYIWAKDIFGGQGQIADWNWPYSAVLTCNVTLEGLAKINPTDTASKQQWNTLEGSALFFRSFSFYNLAQLFAPTYDKTTAASDLGIPLRLSADINTKSTRVSVAETYSQIISDLNKAVKLLPQNVDQIKRNRPSKAAALALLARVYLSMREYPEAFDSANASLNVYSALVDYNSLDVNTSTPFPKTFPESLLFAQFVSNDALIYLTFSQGISVDTNLYSQYSANDLRKSLYFMPNDSVISTKGFYTGTSNAFSGLATDEMYLTRAECYARSGNANAAMTDLNTLLSKRYLSGTFTPLKASNATDALSKVLIERRKELVFRGIRWGDIKRLNKEGNNITLSRVINGQTYTLLPNDPKYVLPIPPDVISISGIQQNKR